MLRSCQLLSIALLFVAGTKTLGKIDGILTNERFVSSQRCILIYTADLLHFMLHRILSVTSVKTVCCHNAIPYPLRDELTGGSFQLYICRLNPKHALPFDDPL